MDFDTQCYGLRRGLAQRPTIVRVQVPLTCAILFIDAFAEQAVLTSTRKVTVCGAAWRSDRLSCACKPHDLRYFVLRSVCRAGCMDFDTQGCGLRRGLAQ